MQPILYLKSWQLFILLIIPGVLSGIAEFIDFMAPVFFFAYFRWIHSIGITMNEKIPADLRPSSSYFTVCCLCCCLYYPYGQFIANSFIHSEIFSNALFFYVVWSFFYSILFSSRMLESSIEGKLVSRSASFKAFVCFLMFPWGVWHIQPAVQRVLNNKPSTDSSPTEQ